MVAVKEAKEAMELWAVGLESVAPLPLVAAVFAAVLLHFRALIVIPPFSLKGLPFDLLTLQEVAHQQESSRELY